MNSPIIDLFLIKGMSNPIGIVMGQFCTPFIVQEAADVPLMNIIWFIPAGLGALLTIWKVILKQSLLQIKGGSQSDYG